MVLPVNLIFLCNTLTFNNSECFPSEALHTTLKKFCLINKTEFEINLAKFCIVNPRVKFQGFPIKNYISKSDFLAITTLLKKTHSHVTNLYFVVVLRKIVFWLKFN